MKMWLLVVGIYTIVFFLSLVFLPQKIYRGWQQFTQRYIFSSAYIEIDDQDLQNIIVTRVKLEKSGYLELVLADGMTDTPGENVIGASAYLPAGEYSNIPIDVNVGDYEAMPSTRIAAGSAIFIVLYEDDGDQMINPDLDPVVRDSRGNAVTGLFTIL